MFSEGLASVRHKGESRCPSDPGLTRTLSCTQTDCQIDDWQWMMGQFICKLVKAVLIYDRLGSGKVLIEIIFAARVRVVFESPS